MQVLILVDVHMARIDASGEVVIDDPTTKAGHACQLEQPWAWDAAAMEFLRRKGILDQPAPRA